MTSSSATRMMQLMARRPIIVEAHRRSLFSSHRKLVDYRPRCSVGVSNILVVEADAIARNLMIRVLSGQGFTVYEAATAAEALDLCKTLAEEQIDLLIADHSTSDRSVTETILVCCPNTKVLQISGWPFEEVQKEQ